MFTSEQQGTDETLYHCSICAMGYRSSAAARACEDTHLDERVQRMPRKPRRDTLR